MDKTKKGRAGEDFACGELLKKGYSITARNYHSRYGEIDIIAEDDYNIAFVEVKARSIKSVSQPREAVDVFKQRKIILTAMRYLQTHNVQKSPRFDVFEVWHNENGVCKFSYITNAFDLSAFGDDHGLF